MAQLKSIDQKLEKLDKSGELTVALEEISLHAQAATALISLGLLSRQLLKNIANEEWNFTESRRHIEQSFSILEKIYATSLLTSPSENRESLEKIVDYPEQKRYRDLRILSMILDYLQQAHATKEPRAKAAFAALGLRQATLLRNSVILNGMQMELGKDNSLAKARDSQAILVLRTLKESAEMYRARYETSRNAADMEWALRFCDSLLPLLVLLQKTEQVQEFKKKHELWERRLHEEEK